MKKLTNPSDFVGRFFFSFKNDELQWQGQIISKVNEGVFLVQLREWTTGESSSQVLYDTAEDWRFALAKYESNKAAVTRSLARTTH